MSDDLPDIDEFRVFRPRRVAVREHAIALGLALLVAAVMALFMGGVYSAVYFFGGQ